MYINKLIYFLKVCQQFYCDDLRIGSDNIHNTKDSKNTLSIGICIKSPTLPIVLDIGNFSAQENHDIMTVENNG